MPYIFGKISLNSYSKIHGSRWPRRFNLSSETAVVPRLKQIADVRGNDCDISLNFFEINRKSATGNHVIFMLLHRYCHRGLGCGKMVTFTLKIFNIFGDVYTPDGTISLCQRDAGAQIVKSHNYSTQVSDPFRPPSHWSQNDMIVTDICQYSMYPIY